MRGDRSNREARSDVPSDRFASGSVASAPCSSSLHFLLIAAFGFSRSAAVVPPTASVRRSLVKRSSWRSTRNFSLALPFPPGQRTIPPSEPAIARYADVRWLGVRCAGPPLSVVLAAASYHRHNPEMPHRHWACVSPRSCAGSRPGVGRRGKGGSSPCSPCSAAGVLSAAPRGSGPDPLDRLSRRPPIARPGRTAPEKDAGIGPSGPRDVRDQIMTAKNTQKPVQQPARTPQNRQAITLELVVALAPNHTQAEKMSCTFGLDPVDYHGVRETTEEQVGRSAQVLDPTVNKTAMTPESGRPMPSLRC